MNACPQWIATWSGVDRSVGGTAYISVASIHATDLLLRVQASSNCSVSKFEEGPRDMFYINRQEALECIASQKTA